MTTQPSDPLAAERENERREEIALKPCPFCGPDSDLVFSQPCSDGGFGVTCRNCHTNMDVRSLDRDSVVAAWNRRALPPLPQQGEVVAIADQEELASLIIRVVGLDDDPLRALQIKTPMARRAWDAAGEILRHPPPVSAERPLVHGVHFGVPATPAEAQARVVALHPSTRDLVDRFATALADKLAKAEAKYGYTDGWLSANWEADCREAFLGHIEKGDPRDVAAYCAFMWHHGWSTSAGSTPKPAGVDITEEMVERLRDFADAVMDAAQTCCTDPDGGPDDDTLVKFTGDDGCKIANDLNRVLAVLTAALSGDA